MTRAPRGAGHPAAGRAEEAAGRAEAAAAEEAALLGLPYVPPDRSLGYGPHPSQVIDYYGAGGPRITVLHGGFWRQAYDRRHLSATAAELARRGFAVALAEYRRVGAGGGWPGTFEDVARVVEAAWDGERQVLLGHSAGGHLALWAAHRAPERVERVVAVAPVADLGYARRLGLSGGAVDELLGREGELEMTDPIRLLPAVRPAVIVHGVEDADVPVEVSRRYAAAARAAGGETAGTVLREVPGTGHYAPLTPGSAAFTVVLTAIGEGR